MKRVSHAYVKKIDKDREPTVKKQTDFKVVDVRQKDTARAATARPKYQNFIPPLQLKPKAVSKLERTVRPESAVLKFLTEPSLYSDPGSIQTFIMLNGITQKHHIAARVIQKAWRKARDNKNMKSFMKFLFSVYKTKMKYPMHLWLLARRYPAHVCLPHYEAVINYMKSRNYIFCLNGNLITNDLKSIFLTFDQYCKTNCILVKKKYDINKIICFVKVMMRPLMKEALIIWRDMKEDLFMLRKQKPVIRTTVEYREVFHELFWTYIFWRRWVCYRKTHNLVKSSLICHSVYLLEWSIFHAKKQQKLNIISCALSMRDVRLKGYSFSTMYNYCVKRQKHRREFSKIQRVAHLSSMSLVFRSFLYHHVQCSIEKSMKYRVLSSWYKVTDKSVINKACLSVMWKRQDLRKLISSITKWKGFAYDESVSMTFLFNKTQEKQLSALRTCFLLLNDFNHYSFVASFINWRKIIRMEKRGKKFVTWSFGKSFDIPIKHYLFDVFRENCLKQIDFTKYLPFKSDFEKKFTTSSNNNNQKASFSETKKRKRKLANLVQMIRGQNVSVSYFPTTVDEVIVANQNIDNFDIYTGNWAKTATSDQIKSLFYRIVIATVNRSKIAPQSISKKLEIIKYRDSLKLYEMMYVRKVRNKQNQIAEIKRKAMVKRMNRDALLLAKKDVYLAAVALQEAVPKFQIEPDKPYDPSVIITDDDKLYSSVEELKNSYSIRQKGYHPMLNSITTLKSGITKSNRKARRPPKQLFTEETNQSALNRPIRFMPENNQTARPSKDDNTIIYEKYRNVTEKEKEKIISEKPKMQVLPQFESIPSITKIQQSSNENNVQTDSKIQLTSQTKVNIGAYTKIILSNNIKFSGIIQKSVQNEYNEEKIEDKKEKENDIITSLEPENEEFTLKEEEEEEGNEYDIEELSEIDRISFPYVNDEEYLSFDSLQRRDILMSRYFEILDILLSRKNRAKRPKIPNHSHQDLAPQDNSAKTHVSRVLRALNPPNLSKNEADNAPKKLSGGETELIRRRKMKKQRKPLFEDKSTKFKTYTDENGFLYSKSECPEFSKVLFVGDTVLTRINLSDSDFDFSDDNSDNEDNSLSTLKINASDIPGFGDLLDKVGEYLNGKGSSLEEQEHLMLSLNQTSELVGDPMKSQIMQILNRLARKAIFSQTNDFVDKDDIKDYVIVSENFLDRNLGSLYLTSQSRQSFREVSLSARESARNTSRASSQPKRKKTIIKRKKRSTIIIKKKFTFTQDLINAIHEGSRLAHSALIKYYDDVSKINPFEGIENLRKMVNDRIKNWKHPPPLENIIKSQKEIYAEEFMLTVGGKTPRRPPSKIRPNTPKTIRLKNPNDETKEYLKIESLAINKTFNDKGKASWSKVIQEGMDLDDQKELIRIPTIHQRPKTQIIKTNTTTSFEPHDMSKLTSSIGKQKSSQLTKKVNKPKWVIESEPEITDEDINFFMFATPYIVPPLVLNKVLEFQDTETT